MASKVLVTGATGFIGSHLIPKLVDNYRAYSLERYVTGRYGEAKKYQTVFGDLRDSATISKLVGHLQPDYVIHLASISPVSYSYEHPQEVIDNNLMGTINLAEACIKVPHFKQFLFAGTSEEYGNNKHEVQKETFSLKPGSPYAISKVACELYLKYLVEAYDFPLTILRPFNTYGRKKDYHFLIENTIVQMLRNNNVFLGNPDPVRDWLYIDDHVKAYVMCLGNYGALGEVFNFATGVGYLIKETVDLIAKKIGFKGNIFWHTELERPGESLKIIGDYSKAKKMLNWEPETNLDRGLNLTIKYWKKQLC